MTVQKGQVWFVSKLLKIEIRKALKNRAFFISVAIGIIFAVLSLIYGINIYNNDMESMKLTKEVSGDGQSPMTAVYTLFNHWIGGESASLGTSVYYFIFPILCALPYGWSYCVERKSGYTRTMIVHSGKGRYYMAKYISTFISGGLAMALPLIASILMTAAFFPAVKPDVIYDIYTGVFKNTFMSELYYGKPFLHLFLLLCINFVFCGLLACCSMAATSVIRQKHIVTLVPFVICLMLNLLTSVTFDASKYRNVEYSPFYFLRACGVRCSTSGAVIGIIALVMFLVTFITVNVWERRHEVY